MVMVSVVWAAVALTPRRPDAVPPTACRCRCRGPGACRSPSVPPFAVVKVFVLEAVPPVTVKVRSSESESDAVRVPVTLPRAHRRCRRADTETVGSLFCQAMGTATS